MRESILMKPFYQLATDIMGTKIKTQQGEEVGVVQNIMVDAENESIIYVALCYASFMGKMHRNLAIPNRILTKKYSSTSNSYYLELEKEQLLNTPETEISDWTRLQHNCIYELLNKEDPSRTYKMLVH